MELIQYAPALAPQILDLIAKNLDWPGADDIAERLKQKPPKSDEEIQQMIMQAVQQSKEDEGNKIKWAETNIKRMKLISDIMTDDDKVNLELLKLMDANNASDEEIRLRAVEMINQMKAEQSSYTEGQTQQ